MREMDTVILDLFSQGLIEPHLATSEELSEILDLLSLYIQKIEKTNYSFDVPIDKTGPFIHFVLDLLSVVSVQSGIITKSIIRGLAQNPVRHRQNYPRELEHRYFETVINDPDLIVRFAADIERTSRIRTSQIPIPMFDQVAMFIAETLPGNESASVLMLLSQIEAELCRPLFSAISARP